MSGVFTFGHPWVSPYTPDRFSIGVYACPMPPVEAAPPPQWIPATCPPVPREMLQRCRDRAAELRAALAMVELMRAELETLEAMIAAAEKAGTK